MAVATAQAPMTSFPGEGLIRYWAGITGVNVDAAAQRAAQMYAGDPAAIQAGSHQAAAVADGLTGAHADLQAAGADASQAWEGQSANGFLTSNGVTMDQVNQARSSARGMASALSATADNVASAKNGVATASGLIAARLGTLQANIPAQVDEARQDVAAWVSAINGLNARGTGESIGAGIGRALGGLVGEGDAGAAAGGAAGGAVGGAVGEVVNLPGSVDDWINQALDRLGLPHDPAIINALKKRIQQESGGNPAAVNNWDSNAAAGTPSKGILQTIDSTFQANGGGNIFNPVDNITAAINYMGTRYGGGDKVAGIMAVAAKQGGY